MYAVYCDVIMLRDLSYIIIIICCFAVLLLVPVQKKFTRDTERKHEAKNVPLSHLYYPSTYLNLISEYLSSVIVKLYMNLFVHHSLFITLNNIELLTVHIAIVFTRADKRLI